jgi:replicative DNA helicase
MPRQLNRQPKPRTYCHDPAQLKDKVPPHNAEAEQAALGALLLDPDAVPHILRYLRPDDFYVNANKHVFAAVVSFLKKARKQT